MKQKFFVVFSICLMPTFFNGYFESGDGGSPKLCGKMLECSFFEKGGEGGSPRANGGGGPKAKGGTETGNPNFV